MSLAKHISSIVPGLTLSVTVTLLAITIEWAETTLFGRPWVDGLVFAILIGTFIHTVWSNRPALKAGVDFAAKTVLEIAIVLLGASTSLAAIGNAGIGLVAIVAGVVVVGLATSYGIGRLLGLSDKLAVLVACGNSICGNSAIVAAAPVIDAHSDDVAASIAFTAALGIIVVLLLPLIPAFFGMSQRHYGMLAGLTVYAVPQVLAATVPVGPLSAQVGALIKLMRVLMLGPVILMLGVKESSTSARKASLTRLVPWFIVGFLVMMACNSIGLIPEHALPPIRATSTALTIVSMAALGLSVDLRTVLSSGGRVLAAGALSILALGSISLVAIYLLLPALAAL